LSDRIAGILALLGFDRIFVGKIPAEADDWDEIFDDAVDLGFPNLSESDDCVDQSLTSHIPSLTPERSSSADIVLRPVMTTFHPI
jgi:hypothetical protein